MTDSFVFDLIEKFNASTIVSLDYANGDSHIVLKKKDACVFSGADSVSGAIGAASPVVSGTADSAVGGAVPGAATSKADLSASSTTATTSSGASSGISDACVFLRTIAANEAAGGSISGSVVSFLNDDVRRSLHSFPS